MSEQIIAELSGAIKNLQRKNSGKTTHYPAAFKELVAKSVDSGLSISKVAKITGISWDSIRKWHKNYHFQELHIDSSAEDNKENVLIFRYPNGLVVEIADRSLTADLVQLLKGA